MESLSGVIPAQTEGTVVSYYFTLNAEGLASSKAPRGGEIVYTLYVGGLTESCEDFEDSDGGFTALVAGQNEEGADDWMWARPSGSGVIRLRLLGQQGLGQ